MKTIKITIKEPGWFPKETVMIVRECKTGYPYLKDWKALKAALSEFKRCKAEEVEDET